MDLRHIDEKKNNPIVEIGVDLTEFYVSVEWDILAVPAIRSVVVIVIVVVTVSFLSVPFSLFLQ